MLGPRTAGAIGERFFRFCLKQFVFGNIYKNREVTVTLAPSGTVSFGVPEWNLERPGGRITCSRSYNTERCVPLRDAISIGPDLRVSYTTSDTQLVIEIVACCFQHVPDRTVGTEARRFKTKFWKRPVKGLPLRSETSKR